LDLQHPIDGSANSDAQIKLLTKKLADLTVEVAANRLLLRGLLLGWIRESGQRGLELEAMLARSIESMMPQALKLDGLSAEVQAQALQTLRRRAEAFLADPTELEL
jgi:hypothetical protein